MVTELLTANPALKEEEVAETITGYFEPLAPVYEKDKLYYAFRLRQIFAGSPFPFDYDLTAELTDSSVLDPSILTVKMYSTRKNPDNSNPTSGVKDVPFDMFYNSKKQLSV